jgi:hypothetical protein
MAKSDFPISIAYMTKETWSMSSGRQGKKKKERKGVGCEGVLTFPPQVKLVMRLLNRA